MSSTTNIVQITSEERLTETPPFLRAPVKKACPNFFDCLDLSPEHINAFIHACPYGQSCREIQDPHHTNMFYHYNNPPCDGRNCDMTDPTHRMTYHHPKMHDFLIACRYGNGCKYANDYRHCVKYHHCNRDIYPEIPKELK